MSNAMQKLDAFTRGYIECALWTEAEEIGDNTAVEDLAAETLAQLVADCADFQETNAELLEKAEAERPLEFLGHDFWLTRNGHGTGFWDRGLGEVGKQLTDMAHPYGSCSLYIGDDELVYAAG